MRLAVAARVLDQVVEDALGFHPVAAGDGLGRQLEREVDVVVGGIDRCGIAHQFGQVDGFQHLAGRARIVQELADDGVHLLDVGHHQLAGLVVDRAHLGFQAQARERRAQIVRDAGEHHGAVGLQLLEVPHHLVEAVIRLGHFRAAALGQRLRIIARADGARGIGQPLERLVDARGDEGRAQHRQHQRRDRPPQPLQPRHVLEAVRADGDPVVVALDLEADPHAGDVVDRGGDHGVLAQAVADLPLDQLREVGIGLRRAVFVFLFARIDLDALVLHQVEQQEAPPRRIGVEQRRPRQLDHADDLHGDLLRARLALENAEALEPCPE